MEESMVAQAAQWVREAVAGQDWLAWLSPHIANLPDLALVIPAPAVALLLLAWSVGRAKKSTEEAVDTLRTGASVLTAGAIKEKPKPANVDQVKALETQIQALSEAQQKQAAALEAKLDSMNAALVAASRAAPIGPEERAKRNEAVGAIVVENTPAAQSFERSVLAGAGLDLTALKAEARADAGRAAEKWRRIAALARGVDDGEALAAYEEAHRLDPSDFWTCVELARLYRRWKGDLSAARKAAEAAERTARGVREQSVAANTLGDVLVKAGDLPGAKSRFEATLGVLEKLAAQNPGSAEAQRDVSVSLNKLGGVLVLAGDLSGANSRFEADLAIAEKLAAQNPGSAEAQRDVLVSCTKMAQIFPKQGWWARAHEVARRLQGEGRLAPADAWMVEDSARRAGEDI